MAASWGSPPPNSALRGFSNAPAIAANWAGCDGQYFAIYMFYDGTHWYVNLIIKSAGIL